SSPPRAPSRTCPPPPSLPDALPIFAEIAATVAPAAHAILLVDQAGWHLSTRLFVPANITIILLPPKCPELNPVENVWQFMRDNRSEEHTSELQSRSDLVCRLLLEKK